MTSPLSKVLAGPAAPALQQRELTGLDPSSLVVPAAVRKQALRRT